LGLKFGIVDFGSGIGGFVDLAHPYRGEEEDREPAEATMSAGMGSEGGEGVQREELDETDGSDAFW